LQRRVFLLLAVLVSFAAPVCQAAPTKTATSDPIKIGFICSLSSVGGSAGNEMLNGIKLYFDQIHYQIAGHKVELVVENDQSDPLTAVVKAKKLVEQEKVDILAGFQFSNVGLVVVPIAEKLQVPTIISFASASAITMRPDYKWVLRTSRSTAQTAFPFGEWAYKTLKYKNVATLAVDYAYGWDVVGAFQKSFEQAGGRIIQKQWMPLGFKDFKMFLQKIKPEADAVLIVTAGDSAKLAIKQFSESKLMLPILGDTSTFDEEVLREEKDYVPLGSMSSSTYSAALNTSANKAFVKAYESKYSGAQPSHLAESSYTTGMWIKKALESIHGDVSDKEKVLAALRHVSLSDAPRGPIRLDAYGNPIQNVYIRKVQQVNGQLQNVVVHTFTDVSQFWKYTPDDILKQPRYSRDFPPCKYCSE